MEHLIREFGQWLKEGFGWFVDIEESHTSQSALTFLRSPHPERSWITAAGCVLDTAAISTSTIAKPHDPRADVLLRGDESGLGTPVEDATRRWMGPRSAGLRPLRG